MLLPNCFGYGYLIGVPLLTYVIDRYIVLIMVRFKGRLMDVTSITLGKEVRNNLRAYRDRIDADNYNEAIAQLLDGVDNE